MKQRVYYHHHEPAEGDLVGDNARGVLCILQEDQELGWVVTSDADYYILRDGRWYGVDINGLFDFLLDTGMVLFGRMVDRGEYAAAMSEAMQDKALAEKTGWQPRRYKERRP